MSRLRSEDGMTFTEVLVGALIGVVLSLALFAFIDTTSRSSEKTAARIDAAKLGRPVLASVIDRLHSTCVAPEITPVQPGSDGDTLIILHQSGSAVTLTPDRLVLQYAPPTSTKSGSLTETTYRAVGGTPPNWTFASAPAGPQRLLIEDIRGVGNSSSLFTYYVYGTNGVVTPITPAAGGLTQADAARVVQVKVGFEVIPRTGETSDSTTFSDTAVFRFSPPAADATVENKPCA